MNAFDILSATGGVDAIAKQLGIPPAMAEAGARALLPAVVGGFNKPQAAPAAGSGGLADILGQLGGTGMLTNVLGPEPTQVDRGNDVLGQIFGTKEVSRTVADQASGSSGVDAATLKKMLPILAMLVAGFLSARNSGGAETQADGGMGGLGSILGSVLGGGGGQSAGAGGGALGGLGGLLDMDGDGNPLDDIIGMAGKMMR